MECLCQTQEAWALVNPHSLEVVPRIDIDHLKHTHRQTHQTFLHNFVPHKHCDNKRFHRAMPACPGIRHLHLQCHKCHNADRI